MMRKNLKNVLFLFLGLTFSGNFNLMLGQTNVSGVISINTFWDQNGSPYIVTGDVIVDLGVTLTIEHGVEVKFTIGKSLQVDGTLVAQGMVADSIKFTSNQATPAIGDWEYIHFTDSSADAVYDGDGNYVSGSILQYCVIEYAGGVNVNDNGALRIEGSSPFIDHCAIKSNKSRGIGIFNNGGPKITFNFIGDNSAYGYGGGIYMWNCGNVEISNNTIHNNTAFHNGFWGYISGGGIYVGGSNGQIQISNNTITNNTVTNNRVTSTSGTKGAGIYAKNCKVDSNTIRGNQGGAGSMGGGIYAEDSEITGNLIDGNKAEKGGGIYSLGDNNKTQGNIITNNESTQSPYGGGIFISGNPQFNFNEIHSNIGYDLYNANHYDSHDANVNATDNNWGTTDETTIQGMIYDWFDDCERGIVDYKPAGPAGEWEEWSGTVVTKGILVSVGHTLVIRPGTVVKFEEKMAFRIDGTLIARGTATDSIVFTSNNSSPAPGD